MAPNLYLDTAYLEAWRVPAQSGVAGALSVWPRVRLASSGASKPTALYTTFLALSTTSCALILVYSAYGIFAEGDEEEDLSQNAIVKLTRQFIPSTDEYDGDNFFTRAVDGARVATPLLLALVCVELSDVVFAVDSVPAVFGVTTDPFIALTSNVFAILALRQVRAAPHAAQYELHARHRATGAAPRGGRRACRDARLGEGWGGWECMCVWG